MSFLFYFMFNCYSDGESHIQEWTAKAVSVMAMPSLEQKKKKKKDGGKASKDPVASLRLMHWFQTFLYYCDLYRFEVFLKM